MWWLLKGSIKIAKLFLKSLKKIVAIVRNAYYNVIVVERDSYNGYNKAKTKKRMEIVKMKKEKIEVLLETAWDNLLWDNMEVVLYKDGDNWTRQQGSKGTDEDDIVYKMPLDLNYWGDSNVVKKNDEGDIVTDEDEKENFMSDMLHEVVEALGEKEIEIED